MTDQTDDSVCRAGCSTPGLHQSWGQCLKAARVQFDLHSLKYGAIEKRKDKRLTAYESARNNGLQPANTTWPAIRAANETGGEAQTPVEAE